MCRFRSNNLISVHVTQFSRHFELVLKLRRTFYVGYHKPGKKYINDNIVGNICPIYVLQVVCPSVLHYTLDKMLGDLNY